MKNWNFHLCFALAATISRAKFLCYVCPPLSKCRHAFMSRDNLKSHVLIVWIGQKPREIDCEWDHLHIQWAFL